ncbi:Vesicle-associated membrane protein [Actinidia chinensis var. chinensis]|uniref:Vesicle-associated membrane protein n=1 Tax=Actinidia chinensis var. chinensis TaxID=1590841 RepID=A0A2R6QIG3_ACTCC|nr:Vesicle-associated membrane protein [Actinidia chinensis var. chinensis]
MGILYAVVARGEVVLAEFSAAATNAGTAARKILEKTPRGNSDSNASYSQDRYIFHAKRTDGLTVLCMADDSAGRRIPSAFLEDIHQRFARTYGRAIHSAAAYAMNDEFSRVLSQQMDHYTNDPNADRINRLKGEMSQVRTAMLDNINKVLDRGDRLELLVDKTATLQGNTLRFRRQSRRFRNTMWWRNVRLTCVHTGIHSYNHRLRFAHVSLPWSLAAVLLEVNTYGVGYGSDFGHK